MMASRGLDAASVSVPAVVTVSVPGPQAIESSGRCLERLRPHHALAGAADALLAGAGAPLGLGGCALKKIA
jgi:hypothetical protein